MAKMTKDERESQSEAEKELIKEALQRFDVAKEAETEFRRQSKEDLEFVQGEQWNPQALQNRTNAGLPCYTVNKVQEYLRHITNEIRQNKPSIQVDPTGNDGSRDTADLLAGLIRHIEYDSAADTAYDTASWYAAATGLGYIRLVSEYEDTTSNNQKLVIKTIQNPATVMMDPMSKNTDGSDAEWAFIVSDIPVDEYKRKFADSKTAKMLKETGGNRGNNAGMGTGTDWSEMNNSPDWLTENTVRVAEYYYRTYDKKTLYTLQDQDGNISTTYDKPDAEFMAVVLPGPDGSDKGQMMLTPGFMIIGQREVQIPSIKWSTINCNEIVGETTVWPGEFIPIIPVKGNEVWIGGKKYLSGSVRNAKDAQRSYNWLVSIQTQMIASAPLAPFVGFKGQFKDVEHLWRDVNVAPIAYLEVDSEDVNGVQQGLPQRMNQEPAIQAVSTTRLQAADDIKSIFGTFDAAMGNQSNETSGKAILARTNQSNISNYHYYDNLVRSITHLGKIMVQAIPAFYDTERVIRIVNENGTRATKMINTVDPVTGKPKNDFSIGKYDVVIETGPTYATRRQEAAVEMQTLISAYPAAGPAIADLAADTMDWPGSKLVAKRLRAMVPPEILKATGEDTEGDDMDPEAKLQIVQQQLQQASEALKALNAHAEQVEQELKNQTEENKLLKLRSDVDLAKAEMDGRLKSREMDIGEETTVLEFKVKEKELELQERQLAIKEAELGIKAVATASTLNRDSLSAHNEVYDRLTKDAERGGGVGAMPPEMEMNLDNEMGNTLDHTLSADLGGKFNT
jgi:hypothetical protein